jgi:inosine-uridine nucleoside N-ribohydrolase
MSRTPVWFDTDIGVDDAAALLVLGRQEQTELVGISAVAGNVPLSHTYDNARKVCQLMGASVPVYRGAAKPLYKELQAATYAHGEDGLGGAVIPAAAQAERPEAAWDALYRAAVEADGALEVVAVGPLTNLAIALGKYPQLKGLLRRILIMGGAAQGGNVTPSAEFNIYVDPHAAQMVFKSGIPIVMCGLDVTERAYLTAEETAEIGSHDTAVSRFFRDSTRDLLRLHEKWGDTGMALHDVCPVLFLTHPQIFQGQEAGVFVETQGTITNGKTVTDLWSDKEFPVKNAFVVLDVDRPAFVSLVRDAITGY